MKSSARELELLVISDLHLGTYGCHANELLRYLKSVKPKKLILNGDIIDMWQFNKRYWPKSHMKIIKHFIGLIGHGVPVYYVTGNHDEMLRKFVGFEMGTLKIVNKVVIDVDGKKGWIFHGDVFDITMKHSKWLAKLGAIGYDTLILINSIVNWVSESLGRGKISLSKKVKRGVKSAIKFIDDFELTASEIAIENGYDYVICGHIHQPEIKVISNSKGKTTYLNSGDWVESLSALEYNDGKWSLYEYLKDEKMKLPCATNDKEEDKTMDSAVLFNQLVQEFQISRS